MKRTGFHPLLLFLPIFLVVVAGVTVYEVGFKGRGGHGAGAGGAHGPAEFPEIFGVDYAEGLEESGKDVLVAPPPLEDPDYYPCSQCHEPGDANPEPRELSVEHEDKALMHGSAVGIWCLDCHHVDQRDGFVGPGGRLVPFEEPHRLCARCHGTIYRDWVAGLHGKRTGFWNGPRRILSCVHCHRPHDPRFQSLRPLPPPVAPAHIERRRASTGDGAVHGGEGTGEEGREEGL